MHPNEEVVRRGYEAFADADMETIWELFAEDIRWTVPGRSPLAKTYVGRNEVLEFFGQLIAATQGSFKVELIDACANDQRVFCLTRETATLDGETIEGDSVAVYEVRDGRVCSATFFEFDLYTGDEFFSRAAGDLTIGQEETARVEA